MRLLVVEDEPELNRLLKKRLEEAHYSVDACLSGTDALDYLRGAEYDALVLDVMLPGISGLEVLRRMRNAKNATPVLLLTARDGIEDRVTGLDAGADDYLVKPFAFDELLARLRVLLRRAGGPHQRCADGGGPGGGLHRPHRPAGRRAGDPLRPGVRYSGIPDPQPGRGALPGQDQPPCVEL